MKYHRLKFDKSELYNNLVKKKVINRKSAFRFTIIVFILLILFFTFVKKHLNSEIANIINSSHSQYNEKPVNETVPPEKNKITKNVALVTINPPDPEGKGIIEKYGWKNPELLADLYIKAVSTASNNLIEYKITKNIIHKKFPGKKSGFVLDHDYYKSCLSNPDSNCREIINYKKLFDDLGLCQDIADGNIHEIWAFNGPWFGFWEWSVKGPLIYSLQENLPDCGGKTYAIMGFSYERTLAEMLEDLGHRFEAIMVKYPEAKKDWTKFESHAYCGTVHIPPNAFKDYDWDNPDFADSLCDSFLNYPDSEKIKKIISCKVWDCSAQGYLKWWLSHIPGKWWRYVIDPDST